MLRNWFFMFASICFIIIIIIIEYKTCQGGLGEERGGGGGGKGANVFPFKSNHVRNFCGLQHKTELGRKKERDNEACILNYLGKCAIKLRLG